jgi:Fungal chitosanase of glycosyl hydrolase group 75
LTKRELGVKLNAMGASLPRIFSAVSSAQRVFHAALVALLALGCSSGHVSVGDDHTPDAGAGEASAMDPSATVLLGLAAPCNAGGNPASKQISNGLLAPQAGRPADIPVCELKNAIFWRSEFAVDCDGKRTTTCNSQQDPQYQGSTVGKDSTGASLDASVVPYVEVPVASTVFDYHASGLSMGSVAIVIYQDRLAYGVLGHEQDATVIGAASYAMAALLGIDPNPVTGGLQNEDVTYLAFTGSNNVVPALEDEAAATSLAKAAAAELVASP